MLSALGNYVAIAIYSIATVAVTIWAHVEISAFKVQYELNSDAVEKLLKAENGDVPEFSEEELKKYRTKSRFNLSNTAKVVLLKAWFAGAVCYFILWGLGIYVNSLIDMLFILGIVLGMVTDLLTNNVIRFIEPSPGENDKWQMFPKPE